MRITINIDDELEKDIKKRAKKNYLSIQELIEDIVRRSMISYKKSGTRSFKTDDRLVGIFSRDRRGRPRKKKKSVKNKTTKKKNIKKQKKR